MTAPATDYRPLPTKLQKGGFSLQQVARAGDWAVYSQSKAGKIWCYELVFAKKANPCTLGDKHYPAREVYPSNEDWGSLAWSVTSKEEALRRMQVLAEEQAAADMSEPREDLDESAGSCNPQDN